LWAAEDAIKARYSQFITLLESATLDPLEHVKDRATKAVATLLAAKPEGEARLLAALVNKLGDPARRSASGAAYLIGRLLGEHPRMKPVVVREVGCVCGLCG
jgi:ribosome biogenesis protein MAK21